MTGIQLFAPSGGAVEATTYDPPEGQEVDISWTAGATHITVEASNTSPAFGDPTLTLYIADPLNAITPTEAPTPDDIPPDASAAWTAVAAPVVVPAGSPGALVDIIPDDTVDLASWPGTKLWRADFLWPSGARTRGFAYAADATISAAQFGEVWIAAVQDVDQSLIWTEFNPAGPGFTITHGEPYTLVPQTSADEWFDPNGTDLTSITTADVIAELHARIVTLEP